MLEALPRAVDIAGLHFRGSRRFNSRSTACRAAQIGCGMTPDQRRGVCILTAAIAVLIAAVLYKWLA
jgi:hypothetical protein